MILHKQNKWIGNYSFLCERTPARTKLLSGDGCGTMKEKIMDGRKTMIS
jgi:hypothetical protein